LQERETGEAEPLVAEGEERFAAGDFHGAIASARAALRGEPRSIAALSLLAAAHDALDAVNDASTAHEEALRIAPRDADAIAEAADFYLRRGTDDANPDWLNRARELGALGASVASRAQPDALVEFVLIETDALQELGEVKRALGRIEETLGFLPDDHRLQLELGLLLFETCEFDQARRQLEIVLRADPSNPSANQTLGLIAERGGDAIEAAARFRAAHAAAPDEFPVPIRFSPQHFDRAVEDALEHLPPQVGAYLENVAISVEDVPSSDDLLSSDPPLSPSILGIFRGSPLGDKASMNPWSHFPSSIVLY
jgi:tetratricopeptide (TPR) repeat protein